MLVLIIPSSYLLFMCFIFSCSETLGFKNKSARKMLCSDKGDITWLACDFFPPGKAVLSLSKPSLACTI